MVHERREVCSLTCATLLNRLLKHRCIIDRRALVEIKAVGSLALGVGGKGELGRTVLLTPTQHCIPQPRANPLALH